MLNFGESTNLVKGYVKQIILDYCKLDSLPEGLKYTYELMCIDFYNICKKTLSTTVDVDKQIAEVKRGDTDIKYVDVLSVINKFNKNQFLNNYTDQLVEYRKLDFN